MVLSLLCFSSHTLTIIFGLIPAVTVLVWLRHLASDIIIRRAGGARAPVLAGNLLSGKTSLPLSSHIPNSTFCIAVFLVVIAT